MKKKIISLCLVIALAATAVVGATLAYFTDTESANNVFTAGSVRIKLIEQEREYKADGSLKGLKDFTPNKQLVPSHNDAQGEKDRYGMSVVDNYVDKIVTVKNTGNSDAYVRVIVAIPAALEETNPQQSMYNVLHWNLGNKFTPTGDYDTTANPQPENPEWANVSWKYSETVTINQVSYNLYIFTYKKPIKAGETTKAAAMVGFYLDKGVDCEYDAQGNPYYTFRGQKINYAFANGTITIPVFAQAVQSAGFSSADEAFTASGLANNPWA